MTTPVLMPQMGLEVSGATIVGVLVTVGDEVVADQPLFEVETEKATTEIAAPCSGFVVSIDVSPGDEVAVGAVVALIGATADVTSESVASSTSAGLERPRRRAAPVARRAATALGVDLESVRGTGPRGRITLRDVELAASTKPADRESPAGDEDRPGDVEPLGKVRRVTARRMTESQLIPQYRLERDVDVTHLLAQKKAIAAGATLRARPGVNDLLIQAIAEMVARHPALATAFVDGLDPGLRRHPAIGVGLAVATDRGLMVPVIPAADRLGLGEIATQRARLVDAARAGRLSPDEMAGAAITLSNLGGFGVDRFTAMLNPGESAIVAVGRVAERVVPRGRALTVVPVLTVTVSFDHRAIDGAVGASALAELAALLEGGMTWRP